MKQSIYISFVGSVLLPSNLEALKSKYPVSTFKEEVLIRNRNIGYDDDNRQIEIDNDYFCTETRESGFRENLDYKVIDGKDSITVYMAVIDDISGHLVVSCPAGGWLETAFVIVENGSLKKSSKNFNPNPVRQLG